MTCETRTAPGPATDAPMVFVTGASRSGTSMLARILGGHPRILPLEELHFFGALCPMEALHRPLPTERLRDDAACLFARAERGLWNGGPSPADRTRARQVVDALAEGDRTPAGVFAATTQAVAVGSGRAIPCEQTPRNIYYLERLLAAYPNARAVHIIRDPRAVLASQKARWNLRRLGAPHIPRAEMVRNWINYHPWTMTQLWLAATREALRLRGHPRLYLVRFEDLAAHPETEVWAICEFLGIGFKPSMLDVPDWGSSQVVHSGERRGVSKEAVARWREQLSPGERYLCEKLAAPLMATFDYPPTRHSAWSPLLALPAALMYPLHLAGVMACNPMRAWTQFSALYRQRRAPSFATRAPSKEQSHAG